MEKIAFIVNPMAQSGATGKHLPHIKTRILAFFENAEIFVTERQGHAIEIARDCTYRGYGLVVAIGGDGTANEVLNGFMTGMTPANKNAGFSFINQGTGGDLQKSLGFEPGLDENLARIKRGWHQMVDTGKVQVTFADGSQHSRYFLNIASCGLSAEVAARINQSPAHLNGKLAYYWASLRSIFAHRTWRAQLELNGKVQLVEKLSLLAIANGKFFGGGMKIAPSALMEDGQLDKIAVSSMTPWFFLSHGWRVYNGSHVKLSQVSSQHCTHLRAQCLSNDLIGVEVEGENFGFLPATFEVMPKSLKLIV